MNKYLLSLTVFFMMMTGYPGLVKGQLLIDTVPTPTQLVQNTLLGTGVAASNVTYTGGRLQYSKFDCNGPCNVGFSSGILLTSGNVFNAPGVNNNTGASGIAGTPSDPDLNALHPMGTGAQDASVLEFNFRPAADVINFRYVWASEEYSDYVNSGCNDYFGFFMSGFGITGKKNIALVPNSTTPISINTVNNGQAPGLTAPNGPCTNCAYFKDNHGSNYIQYDGLTTVLTATGQVCPCQDYHMKLAVQDFCDPLFDSGVFLEANSFSAGGYSQIAVFANGNQLQLNDTLRICPGDSVELYMNLINGCEGIWNNGDTATSIWVKTPGKYYAAFSNQTPYCYATTPPVVIAYSPAAFSLTANGPLNFCVGDSVVLTANGGSGYLWSNGATTPSITVTTAGNYYCIVNPGQACSDTTNQLTVTTFPGSFISISPSGPQVICSGQSITLTASTPQVLWSTGATTQSITVNFASTYTATPTAAGFCPKTASTVVTSSTNPSANISGNLNICQGASTTLSVFAGQGSYLWSTGQTTNSISVNTANTYTVTVTNAAGCTATNSKTVNVSTAPAISISGDFDFCLGNSSNLSVPAGYATYNWSNGATSPTCNVSLPGVYTVTVTNVGGCSSTTSQVITVYNNPLPYINGVTALCQGASANLQANPTGLQYLWSSGSTSPTIQPTVAGPYTVTVTDGNGCSGTASQNVTVNTNPVPVITGPASVCAGGSATLDAGAGFTGYAWSNGATTSSINVSATNNYTVTVTDANGCSGTATSNFNVLPFTTPVISGPAGFCTGTSASLSLNSGYAGYVWSNGATTSTIGATNGGAYTVTVTAANGCSGNTSYSITQWPLPAAQITGITAVCSGQAANLQAAPSGMNYLWSTGVSTSSIQPNQTGSFTVTVTDPNGCSNTATQQVTVHTNPTPVITGIFAACQGAAGLLDAGLIPGATYNWSTGATTSSIQPTGTGNYTVTITDAFGCSGTTTQAFTLHTLPAPVISGSTSFCQGGGVQLSCNSGYQSYQWSNGVTTNTSSITTGGTFTVTVTDANGCTGTASQAVTQNSLPQITLPATVDLCAGNATVLNPGTFTAYQWSDGTTGATLNVNSTGNYNVTVTDANGCTSTSGSSVQVHDLPEPEIQGDDKICDGTSTLLQVTGSYAGYEWSNGNTSATLAAGTQGSYYVTVTDAYGCTGSTAFDLIVIALPEVEITGVTSFCQGDQSILTAVSAAGTFLWSNGSTNNTITVSQSGTYQVTATNADGCTKSTQAQVTTHQQPVAAYIPEQKPSCDELRVNFTNTSSYEPASKLLWKFGDGTVSAEKSPSHVYALPGDYNTSLRITSPHGCIDSSAAIISLTIPALPEAEYNQSARIVSVFNSEVSFNNTSKHAHHYKWSFGDGQSSEDENPKHIFEQVGTVKIKLHAFNEAECRDEFETTLEVVPFYVPNAFTPNNDGKNDVFFDGVPYMNLTSYDMKVFNRWGQVIYQTESFLRPWDGFLPDGNPAPEGLYTYMIKIISIKGKYFEYPGTFSLIR